MTPRQISEGCNIRTLARWLAMLALLLVAQVTLAAGPALALKPITLKADQDRLEITTLGEAYDGTGDSL